MRLKSRVDKLQPQQALETVYEVWTDEGNGVLRTRDGRALTQEAFKLYERALPPHVQLVTVRRNIVDLQA